MFWGKDTDYSKFAEKSKVQNNNTFMTADNGYGKDGGYLVGTNLETMQIIIDIYCETNRMNMSISSDEARYLAKMLELCAARLDSMVNQG